MTPRHRRRLSVLVVSTALLLPLLDAFHASASPIDDKRAEAARIASKLDAMGERLSVLDEQYNQARIALSKAETQVAAAKQKAAETAQRYDAAKAEARTRAVAAYADGGSMARTTGILGGSGTDLLLRNEYLSTAANGDQQAIDNLQAAKEDLATQQAALDKQKAAASRVQDTLANSRKQQAQAVAQQQALLSQVKGQLDGMVKAEEARRAAEAARRAQAALAARQAVNRPGRVSRGRVVPPPGTDAPAPSAGAGAAVAFAKQQVGKPYEWGASGPNSYDCSGLTMASWRQGGVSLPHSASAQYSSTTHVAMSAIQPGDLLFYGSDIHHVGIYVGGGTMIEAPHSGTDVRYASIYRSDLVGAGRP